MLAPGRHPAVDTLEDRSGTPCRTASTSWPMELRNCPGPAVKACRRANAGPASGLFAGALAAHSQHRKTTRGKPSTFRSAKDKFKACISLAAVPACRMPGRQPRKNAAPQYGAGRCRKIAGRSDEPASMAQKLPSRGLPFGHGAQGRRDIRRFVAAQCICCTFNPAAEPIQRLERTMRVWAVAGENFAGHESGRPGPCIHAAHGFPPRPCCWRASCPELGGATLRLPRASLAARVANKYREVADRSELKPLLMCDVLCCTRCKRLWVRP